MASHLQKIFARAAFGLALTVLLGACASPPPVPRQVQEYERHRALGLEKHAAGQIAEARSAFLRSLGRAELDDDPALIATALLNLAAIELLLDNTDAAGTAYARAAREARLAGDAQLEWQAISGLAEATRRLGQPAKALELFAARPATAKPDDDIRLPAEVSRARALADSGQGAAGLALLDSVENSARQRPPPDPALAAALHARATLLLADGKFAEAVTAARAALQLDRQRHHPPSVADDHHLLGQLALRMKDPEQARHHLERARAIFANTGQTARATAVQAATPAREESR